jgi:AraC-like DNA-binding protein
VPAGCALRIPPRRTLLGSARGDTVVRTFAFAPDDRLRSSPDVVHVTPLLDAVIDRLVDLQQNVARDVIHEHLVAVFVDEAYGLTTLPLVVRQPISPIGTAAAAIVAADPSETLTLEEIAGTLGVSVRSVERAFKADTDLSFREWRVRLRLSHALERLSEGSDVQSAALESGYASPSAFVAAVRRLTGLTPHRLGRQKKTRTARKLT